MGAIDPHSIKLVDPAPTCQTAEDSREISRLMFCAFDFDPYVPSWHIGRRC
jgi:hypothetical protein